MYWIRQFLKYLVNILACITSKHSPVFSLMSYFVLDTTNRWLAWFLCGYPLQYSCLENSMDRGTWVGYSSWGHKESDTTEWLTLSFHILQSSFVLRGHVEKKKNPFQKRRKVNEVKELFTTSFCSFDFGEEILVFSVWGGSRILNILFILGFVLPKTPIIL